MSDSPNNHENKENEAGTFEHTMSAINDMRSTNPDSAEHLAGLIGKLARQDSALKEKDKHIQALSARNAQLQQQVQEQEKELNSWDAYCAQQEEDQKKAGNFVDGLSFVDRAPPAELRQRTEDFQAVPTREKAAAYMEYVIQELSRKELTLRNDGVDYQILTSYGKVHQDALSHASTKSQGACARLHAEGNQLKNLIQKMIKLRTEAHAHVLIYHFCSLHRECAEFLQARQFRRPFNLSFDQMRQLGAAVPVTDPVAADVDMFGG